MPKPKVHIFQPVDETGASHERLRAAGIDLKVPEMAWSQMANLKTTYDQEFDLDTVIALAPEVRAHLGPLNQAAIDAGGIEKSLIELVKIRASQINGCAFCLDMHTREARALGETEERLHVLAAWHESPVFADRERAALGPELKALDQQLRALAERLEDHGSEPLRDAGSVVLDGDHDHEIPSSVLGQQRLLRQ